MSRTERSVARRVRGLGASTSNVEADEALGGDEEGRSRRKGRGLVCVTGELRTASRTGSNAGIPDVEATDESKITNN